MQDSVEMFSLSKSFFSTQEVIVAEQLVPTYACDMKTKDQDKLTHGRKH